MNPGKATGREVQVPYEVDGRKVTLFRQVVGFEVKNSSPHWIVKYRDDGTQESVGIHDLMNFLVMA